MKKGNYNRIKAVLVDLHTTSKELAEGMGYNPVTVSRWCTNDQQPSLSVLTDIADYLKIDVRLLMAPNKYASSPGQTR